MLAATTVLKKSDHQVSCNLNDEVAILDIKNALYFGLNDVGAHIWQLLDEPRSVEQICGSIAEEFDVVPTACREDVLRFLAGMQEAGLIETAN
jgi:hypothetical protein